MVHCESVTLHSVTVHSVMNCYYIVKYSASESTAESEMITCHGQTVGAFIPRPTRPHLGNFSSAETTNITTPPDTCHECPPPTHGGCGAPGCAVRTAAVDSGCTIRADVAPIVVGQEIRKYENPFSYHRILAHVIRQLSNSPRPSHRGAGSIAFSSARHVTYLRKEGGRGKGGGALWTPDIGRSIVSLQFSVDPDKCALFYSHGGTTDARPNWLYALSSGAYQSGIPGYPFHPPPCLKLSRGEHNNF